MPILSANASFVYPMLDRVDPASIEPTAASAVIWIKNHYGVDLLPGEHTDRFDSHNDPIMWLKNPVVEEVTEIRVNERILTDWAQWVRVSPEGRVSIKNRSMWYEGQFSRFWNQLPGFSPGVDNVEIDYTSAGRTQAEIDLYVGAVVNWWIDSNRRSGVVTSESIGDRSYSIDASSGGNGIPKGVRGILSGLIPKRAC